MSEEKWVIDANALMDSFRSHMVERYDRNKCTLEENCKTCQPGCLWRKKVMAAPTVDAVEVVRCQNCVHAEPLDRNCEINTCNYMHCKLYRGEETKNVWHKYKKYYKDYSLVERDGFCSDGAKMDGDGNG